MNPTEIRRTAPAQSWNEAFPLGNGRIGAMAYCDLRDAFFDLSESTFVSGLQPSRDTGSKAPPGAPAAFLRARAAAAVDDYQAMETALADFIGNKGEYGTNLPLGRLRVRLSPKIGASDEQYERVLDIASGIATWRDSTADSQVRWKAFISVGCQVLAIRVESTQRFFVEITVEDLLVPVDSRRCGRDLCFSARALEKLHSDGRNGIAAAGLIRIQDSEEITDKAAAAGPAGTARTSGMAGTTGTAADAGSRGFARVDIFVALETDFPDGQRDPRKACETRIRDAETAGFDRLLGLHEQEHRTLFDRVSLDLGEGEPGRAALLFQFGRYLLMSSSRPGSPLPAHLQGVWNDSVACRIGWTCDLHLDVNTQMNYWPAESTRLPECAEPLFRWIRDRLVPEGEKTARDFYGLPGWAAELTANAFGRASPYWHLNLAPYPTGGAWLASQMAEHFLYSDDTVFLSETLLPVFRGASEFFLGYLFDVPDKDGLASGPSISPENAFLENSKPRRASISPTCEITVIRETLECFAHVCAMLDLPDPLAAKAVAALRGLPDFRITRDGALAEWSHGQPAADPNHRHMSHLTGLYPFRSITPDSDLAIACAASVSIFRRTNPAGLWEDTGWARAALALYSARLGDAAALEGHLAVLAGDLAFPNLMIRHPPTRGAPSFADVYELDGNTGFTAAVAECLLRSSPGGIELLPALPPSWESGRVRGLGASHGLVVDIEWEKSLLSVCTVRAAKNVKIEIGYKTAQSVRSVGPGEILRLDRDLRSVSEL